MHNLVEYSDNYFTISRSLWSYYRDEIDGTDDMASQGISFVKTKIIGKVLE